MLSADARFDAVRTALDELRRADALRRLHQRDTTLFANAEVAAQRLGWLDVAEAPAGWVDRLTAFAADVHAAGLDRVVLCGMGGSSLAPEVFATVFRGRSSSEAVAAYPSIDAGGARVEVLDSTHPEVVRRRLDDTDLSRTLVVVSSKSGTTEETRAFGLHAATLVPSPAHLVAITDPGSELQREADGWRDVFANPPDIGGRYSALSLFGMVPAALAGVDIAEIWTRAAAMRDRCGPDVDPADAPGAVLGAFMAGCARAGRDKLTLLAPPALAPLGDWIEQLVAESTGKQGRGIVPVVGEPVGAPDAYGDDRAFVDLRLDGQGADGVDALTEAGHPVLSIDVTDRLDLGAEYVRWEIATALAGVVLGVDPFDEPNVAESKANTTKVLDEVAGGGVLPAPEQGDLGALLDQVRPGDYVSIQAYLAPSPDLDAALARLRLAIRDRHRVATTVGYGPRFLHSTGQLHKGGPDTCVAVQLVDPRLWEAGTSGPDIPGRPYDFGTLVRAQALGDLRSLRAHDRRVVQLPVAAPGDVPTL